MEVITTKHTPMTSRVQAAMTTLTDKHEIGECVAMAAKFALKYKKTMDRKKLDATTIELPRPSTISARLALFPSTNATAAEVARLALMFAVPHDLKSAIKRAKQWIVTLIQIDRHFCGSCG